MMGLLWNTAVAGWVFSVLLSNSAAICDCCEAAEKSLCDFARKPPAGGNVEYFCGNERETGDGKLETARCCHD